MVVHNHECRAHSHSDVSQLVMQEINRPRRENSSTPIAAKTLLSTVGFGASGLLDVINRLESHYSMRFSNEWIDEISTCEDLVDCIETHCIDSLDRIEIQKIKTSDSQKRVAQKISTVHVSKSEARAVDKGRTDMETDVELFPECIALEKRLQGLTSAGLVNPFLRSNNAVNSRIATIQGRQCISFTSFDYLGLTGHPEVVTAAKAAIDQFGCSASASRMVGGNNCILDELDRTLAEFLGTERAVVFPCGYGTNASVLSHLFGDGDLILYDELAHNSIVQGAGASMAGKRSFRHNDWRALDGLLRDLRSQYRRVVVAIEGVYSMDGDYPDLLKFIEVKNRHGAVLYVDEAHSLGTMGHRGRGICEHFGVDPAEGDLWMGTISKALGAGGGYLAGKEAIVRYLGYTTPAFVFSTACSPPNAAAALESLRVLCREPDRVTRLRERSNLFLKLANDCNLDTGASRDTPVIPVILGSSARAIHVSQALFSKGINAQPILYPAVRESAARIRFFLTSEHTEEQICHTVATLSKIVADSAGMVSQSVDE